jgi:hypothetical protein
MTSYVRSKTGSWHVLVAEVADNSITECGLALRDALVGTLPTSKPRRRPCESCRWPEGYPKWEDENNA